jgi:hypothetical protein
MTWYDGGNRLPKELAPKDLLPDSGEVPISGSLIIGDKGALYTPGDYGGGGHIVDLEGHVVDAANIPDVKFPVSKGHWEDFMAAIRGQEKNVGNFPDYAGPLAETILLGNLAVWPAFMGTGEKILWDAKSLKVKNGRDVAEQVAEIIKPTYRAGYHL